MAETTIFLLALALLLIPQFVCVENCFEESIKQYREPIPGTNHVVIKNNLVVKCNDMTEYNFGLKTQKYKTYDIHLLSTYAVNITKLPEYVNWFNSLENIEIKRNNAFLKDDFVQNLTHLKSLVVSGSDTLTEYMGLYISSRHPYLTLKFENNKINKIESLCKGQYNPLWSLDLTNNNITSFTKAEIGSSNCLSKLWKLTLKFNKLTSLNAEIFLHLPRLIWADLSYNKLTMFNSNLNNTSIVINLRTIYLWNNNLHTNMNTNMNTDLFKFFNIRKSLSLDHNNISNLPINVFNGLTKLEYLDLSNNELYQLDPRIFFALTVLKELNIRDNRLVKFDLPIFKHLLNSLRYLHLTGNPWDCTELKQLLTYMLSKNITNGYSEKSSINSGNLNDHCINSIILKQLSHLQENITKYIKNIFNRTSTELLEKLNENTKNITVLHESVEDRFNKNISHLTEYYKEELARQQLNATRLTEELQNTSNQTRLIFVILAVFILIVIVLCLILIWLVMVVRKNSRNGHKTRAEEVEDKEKTPATQEVPDYEYIELPAVNDLYTENIYEEPSNRISSTARGSMCSENSLYGAIQTTDENVRLPTAHAVKYSAADDKKGITCQKL